MTRFLFSTWSFSSKSAIFFILVISAIIIIDSTIIKFVAFSNKELPVSWNTTIFVVICSIFVLCNVLLLNYVKAIGASYKNIVGSRFKLLYWIIFGIQNAAIINLVMSIFQVVTVRQYNIISLFFGVYAVHLSGVLFLVVLVYLLAGWFLSSRNYAIVLYSASFTIMCLNLIISLVYVVYELEYQIPLVKPYSIHQFLVNLPRSELANFFGSSLDLLSFLSFILTWIPTAMLLSQYKRRIGKIRYGILVSVPLIYFLFPFETYFASISHKFIVDSPIIFGTVFVLFFSATKQVGGMLFAMVFLTATTVIKRPSLRSSLWISGIGMAVLFGSIEVDTLIYAVYPPFGLVTVSFIALGSYLVLAGMYVSAARISQDAQLRKEFYRSAESQLNLLKTIGTTQMEKQIIKRCKPLVEQAIILEKDSDRDLATEDIKQMVGDVLREIKSRKGLKSERHDSNN